jgi:integrase/recombinase XerD
MRVEVIDNYEFDLSDSVLRTELDCSEFDRSRLGSEYGKGAIVLDDDMQVLPMVSEWLSYEVRYNKMSIGTAKTYGKNIGYFLSYLHNMPLFKKHKQDEAFFDVEVHTILEYNTYLKDQLGLATTTIRNRDATLMNFFNNFLCDSRGNKPSLRQDNPYDDGLISASAKSKLVEMCSVDELIGLLLSTESERERCLIQYMYDSGVRRSEVCTITKDQFTSALNFERKVLIIDDNTISLPSNYKPFFINGVKGRRRETKPRNTIVSEHSLMRVKRYHSSPLYRKSSRKFGGNPPAFLNAKGGRYTPSAISKLLQRLSKRALKRGYIKRSIHPHMMRHGFAGSVLRSPDLGKDAVERLMTVQLCLGHAFLSTTQIYTSLPYDLYGHLCNEDGEVLTRHEIMGLVNKRTKLKIDLRATK